MCSNYTHPTLLVEDHSFLFLALRNLLFIWKFIAFNPCIYFFPLFIWNLLFCGVHCTVCWFIVWTSNQRKRERIFETSLVLVLAIVYSPVMELLVLFVCMRGRERERIQLRGMGHLADVRKVDLERLGCRLVLFWVSFHVPTKHTLPFLLTTTVFYY